MLRVASRRRWLSAAVVILTGCTAGHHSSTTAHDSLSSADPASTLSPSASAPLGDTSLPLDWISAEYSRVSLDMRRGLRAYIKPCMNAAGFRYEVGLSEDVPAFSLYRRFRYRTPEQAEELGYVMDQPPSGPEGTEGEFPSDPVERKAYLIALQGFEDLTTTVPLVDRQGDSFGSQSVPGGCVAAAIEKLYGSFDAYVRYIGDDLWLQQVAGETEAKTRSDPRFLKMIDSWSKCMARSGFTYATPEDAIGADWAEPRPGKVERDTARTDAQCKIDVRYLGVVLELEGTFQRQALEENAGVLHEVRYDRDAMRARAQEAYRTSK